MRSSHTTQPRRGIMRTEVCAVILVALLLVTLLLPLIVSSRNQARRSVVKDRLRNMGMQVRVYHDTYQSLPSVGGPQRERKQESTAQRLERIGEAVLKEQQPKKAVP